VITREIISVSFPPDPLPVPYAFELQDQKYFIIAVTALVFAGAWLFFEKTVLAGHSRRSRSTAAPRR